MVDTTDEAVDQSRKSHFDLLMNAAGEMMIAFKALMGKPENPKFIFDGRHSGLLIKNPKSKAENFQPIPQEAKDALNKAQEILCIEVQNEKIVAQYMASVELRK